MEKNLYIDASHPNETRIVLKSENSIEEYEPEQFPGLIYRLDYPRVVCLIFGSGKMVITGARRKDEILEAVQFIQDELADLL